MREKLIKLIQSAVGGCATYWAGLIADRLIENGVTIPNKGHWIIHSNGKGANATNWAECSYCHVCGSPQWKVCPVCETRMVAADDER